MIYLKFNPFSFVTRIISESAADHKSQTENYTNDEHDCLFISETIDLNTAIIASSRFDVSITTDTTSTKYVVQTQRMDGQPHLIEQRCKDNDVF